MKELELTVHGVFYKEGCVLLCRRRKDGKWTLPGGHFEFKKDKNDEKRKFKIETLRETMKIELKGETGKWKAKIERLCGVYVTLGKSGLPKKVMLIVKCCHVRGEPEPEGGDEMDKTEWVPWKKALRWLPKSKSKRWTHALTDSRKRKPVFRVLP